MISLNKKLLAVSLMVSLFAGIGCNSDSNSSRKTRASAVPLSTSADLVSGGNLLVRIDTDAATSIDQLHVTVDGHDVTSAFRPGVDGLLLGLIDGLPQGASTLRVERRDGRSKPNILELTNHSINGPTLYSPQPEPFICTADTAFGLTIVDPATCAAESRTTWWYRSTAGGDLRTLPSTEEWPDDLAMTTATHYDWHEPSRAPTARRAIVAS